MRPRALPAIALAVLALAPAALQRRADRARPADSPGARLEQLRQEERGPHPPSPQDAAARLGAIGQEYVRSGEIERAIEVFAEAARRDPSSGENLARWTLAYLDHGDFEFARATLEIAAGRADLRPASAVLYAAIAERFASANQLEDAVVAWELAENAEGGNPAIAARLERARRELSVTPGQRLLQGERFAIYSDAAVPEPVVRDIEAHLEREYVRQRDFFAAADLPAAQVVLLYAGRRFFSLVAVPDWVSGVFDGKIRISVDPGAGFTPEVRSVLSHELAHAWIRFVAKEPAAAWLHEGLAQWCEGRRIPRKDFPHAFARHKVFSLAEMERNFARRADLGAARASYLEALGIVEYLVSSRGDGALVCLLRDLGEGIETEEALRRETGLTGGELVSRWRAWAGV